MTDCVRLLFPVFVLFVAGLIIFILPQKTNTKTVNTVSVLALLTAVVAVFVNAASRDFGFTAFNLTDKLPVMFKLDDTGRMFSAFTVIVWLLCGIFSYGYMKHAKHVKSYQGFYLLVLGVLLLLDYSGNMITFYIFYEFMTVLSVPLVIHDRTKEALFAGLKYLFYSLFGAYLVLYGFYFLCRYAPTLEFTLEGVFTQGISENSGLILMSAMFMMLGFSVKAGMFPMHSWLTAAHPVAPGPASAVLSGVIVKCGVLGMVRCAYYIFGPSLLRGSYVQTVIMILSLITVLMGSTMALANKELKRRLAYSTVSQASYIVFGIVMFTADAYTGSCLHVIAHAFAKAGLFLCAGAIIHVTGKRNTEDLTGLGKSMPVTMWCFTVFALTLIGIPPTGGFMSKFYLCLGALKAGVGPFAYIGIAVLMISALLTVSYLLSISVKAFIPGKDFDYSKVEYKDKSLLLTVPVVILAILAILCGVFANAIALLVK